MTFAHPEEGAPEVPSPAQAPAGPVAGAGGPAGGGPDLVLATHNRGKVRELENLLAEAGLALRVATLDRFPHVALPEETGSTFLENARLKAEAVARQTGLPALADDSGLCVDALGGRPGVYSARFAGPDANDAANNARLLRELAGVPAERRSARFRSVVVLALPDGRWTWAAGEARGRILEAPRGAGGFGYDPLFYSDELGMTFAEAGLDAKNAVSHRARALRALLPALRAWLVDGIVN